MKLHELLEKISDNAMISIHFNKPYREPSVYGGYSDYGFDTTAESARVSLNERILNRNIDFITPTVNGNSIYIFLMDE